VVSPFTRPQVKEELQTLLLEMKNDPIARDALASIGMEQFVLIDDGAYDSVRALMGVIPTSAVQP
jgi:ABC-type phosphate/phosphonate transport system substrate-binding protein